MIRNLPLKLDNDRLRTCDKFLHEVYMALKFPERPEGPAMLRFFAVIRTCFADGCALVACDETGRATNWTGDTRLTEWINNVAAQACKSTFVQEPVSGYDAARQTCYLAVPIPLQARGAISSYMILWRSGKLFTTEDMVAIKVAVAMYLGQASTERPSTDLARAVFTPDDSETLAMETQLKNALDAIHDTIIICGSKGEIIWCNRLARTTLEMGESMKAAACDFGWLMSLIHADDVHIASKKIEHACNFHGTASFSARFPTGSRRYQLFECQITPCLKPANIIRSWIFTAWQADRFLLSHGETRISEQGLASLVQNLRVPLGTCKMTLENLNSMELPNDIRSQLEVLQQACLQLYINVSSAFVMTEKPEQEFVAKYSTMCLEEYIDSIIRLRGPELVERDTEVLLTVDPNLPKVLYTDELRFKQIILNIFSMGLREGPRKSALILRLTKELSPKGANLQIEVDCPRTIRLEDSHHISLTFDLDLVIIEVQLPILDCRESTPCEYRTRQVELQALGSYIRSLASSRPIFVQCCAECKNLRRHLATTFSSVLGLSIIDKSLEETRLVVGAINVCIVDTFDIHLVKWLEKQAPEPAASVRLILLRGLSEAPPSGIMCTTLSRPVLDISIIRAVHEAIIRSTLAVVIDTPISPEKLTLKEEIVAKSLATNLATGHPMRIMVVEDSILNQQVLVKTLNKLGYLDVIKAADGQDGLNQFIKEFEGTSPIELIFMDMQMPILDGCGSSIKIREYVRNNMPFSRHNGPHIVAMTANSFSEDRQACLAAGMCCFAGKPVQWERLEQLIVEAHDSLTGKRACICHNLAEVIKSERKVI